MKFFSMLRDKCSQIQGIDKNHKIMVFIIYVLSCSLNMHVQLSSGAKYLIFGHSFHTFVYKALICLNLVFCLL